MFDVGPLEMAGQFIPLTKKKSKQHPHAGDRLFHKSAREYTYLPS